MNAYIFFKVGGAGKVIGLRHYCIVGRWRYVFPPWRTIIVQLILGAGRVGSSNGVWRRVAADFRLAPASVA